MNKIFIGFTEVAGFYSGLTRILRENNHVVKFIGGNEHKYKYSIEPINLLDKFYYLTKRRSFFILKPIQLLIREFIGWIYFFDILFNYDLVIFGYGRSCSITMIDLYLLKLFNKKVLMYMHHGSESRAPIYSSRYEHSSKIKIFISTNINFIRCRLIEKFCEKITANPLSSHFFKKDKILYIQAGLPIFSKPSINKPKYKSENKVIIVHNPTNKILKGTEELKIKLKEYNFKLLNQMNAIDFNNYLNMNNVIVIDQLYSDNPFPATTRECLLNEIPVVISGHDFNEVIPLYKDLGLSLSHVSTPDGLLNKINSYKNETLDFTDNKLFNDDFIYNNLNKIVNDSSSIKFFDPNFYGRNSSVGFSVTRLNEFHKKNRFLVKYTKWLMKI